MGSPMQNTAGTSSTASVSDPAVVATGGFTVAATEGLSSGSQTVATFTDPGGPEATGDYSATIDWGDGSTTAGSLTFAGAPGDPAGTFSVLGSHTYATPGDHPLRVTIRHESAVAVTVPGSTAIDELPVVYREVLLLCELEEMQYQEIAATLGVPVGTVMSRLSRARRALQEIAWRLQRK